jgi:hypothetical protein
MYIGNDGKLIKEGISLVDGLTFPVANLEARDADALNVRK